MADPLLVPRRRVAVELQLSDGRLVSGDAYVAVHAGDGGTEHLVDRLNDTAERFLPIAVGDRHLLIRKAAIVTAFTADALEAAATREPLGRREFRVEVNLAVGSPASGLLLAVENPKHGRALDHLNRLTQDFVALHKEEGITLVNTHHAVAVVERPALDAKTTRITATRVADPAHSGPHPPPV
jgi:hypothetical protein